MSFSSRRRNYFLTPHRRDGLIEWMKSMLMHSFVLDALATTGGDTFSHFEELVNEHRDMMCCNANTILYEDNGNGGGASSSTIDANLNPVEPRQSRLKRLVPTVGIFHTSLPLRKAYEIYNAKYRLDKRRHLAISFNEIRHIMNLAQIMAMTITTHKEGIEGDADHRSRWSSSSSHPSILDSPSLVCTKNDSSSAADNIPEFSLNGNNEVVEVQVQASVVSKSKSSHKKCKSKFNGPSLITFDGDQTLYSDGANFESNPKLANYLYLLLKNDVTVAVVTAAGYEYDTSKYELRLSGLLQYFKNHSCKLTKIQLNCFYLFGGECNYLLRLDSDYKLHPVNEIGPGGWMTSTKYLGLDSPANWSEHNITQLLDLAECSLKASIEDQNLRNARFIRKKRSVGLVPASLDDAPIPREALDETVLRVQDDLDNMLRSNTSPSLPYCAFNGGRDVWVDVGNKRVGVQLLQSYLGVPAEETLHIGDQFLNTGNDYAARQTCPCIWITSPDETTYVLKSILRLAGIVPTTAGVVQQQSSSTKLPPPRDNNNETSKKEEGSNVDFTELERRTNAVGTMDVFTGEIITHNKQ
ncbi:IMP-specific 5-nucleotidase [Fragilariopsis cylindrus CCMP1102]|uniref:IMP-specific 5'-nucleotidase 1 n=1 Tax=Fragilariopsis cylindrus CCMP1102 TaxID=635003 RepID=A0A1E7F1Z0_9STRA|nr:IMP-specific 5-nucleotidase [Fragilariopsis cylindrus CCMP1102]|eukprot:OEU12137.1 IMP-specific 5-nucleotidase [Fragilariopsis cylindrus CCMP1102]